MIQAQCDTFRGDLDFYLDHELSAERTAAVANHVDSCPSCRAELEAISELRDAVRTAGRNVAVPSGLGSRVRAGVRQPKRPNWTWNLVAIAAMLVVAFGATEAYRYYRYETSPAGYIARWSRQVSAIVRVGLSDHLHCAVFGSVPTRPQPVTQMVDEMGGQYKDLLPVIKDRIPRSYQVMTAHRCTVEGRHFVHLAARDGQHLLSVVITRKGAGESFDVSRLVPALVESGIPIYRSGADRFQIAAFETPGHLVYLISDGAAKDNMDMMMAFAPALSAALRRIES